MFSCSVQNLPQIYQSVSVQFQRLNCGASCRSQPYDQREIVIPSEMCIPFLPSRMIQRNFVPAYRIISPDFDVFVSVAALTRQRKIFYICLPAEKPGDDMFRRKGFCCESVLGKAVFAAVVCPFRYNSSLFGRDPSLRHRRAARFPALPSGHPQRPPVCAPEPLYASYAPHLIFQSDPSGKAVLHVPSG